MNAANFRRCSRLVLASGVALLMFLATESTAKASPIHRPADITASVVGGMRSWVNFLNGGQQVWSQFQSPPVTLAVREIMQQALRSANATSNPWVQYLTWRRDLDPVRFDHWHPFMGHELQNLPPPPPPSNPQQPQGLNPGDPPPDNPPPDNPGHDLPPAFPEPSSWMISLGILGAGLWGRRRYTKGS